MQSGQLHDATATSQEDGAKAQRLHVGWYDEITVGIDDSQSTGYSPDHWGYATRLTVETVDSKIELIGPYDFVANMLRQATRQLKHLGPYAYPERDG